MKPSTSLDAAGGAVWCMEASPDHSQLAAGCEDGRVCFVSAVLGIYDGIYDLIVKYV